MNTKKFYIDGQWVTPHGAALVDVINPATEGVLTQIAMADAVDVDRAVLAARAAFGSFAATSKKTRIDLLKAIIEVYRTRMDDFSKAIVEEMGAPKALASESQTPSGLGHFEATLEVLEEFDFEETLGTARIYHEPAGVCALITPWNWPLNQIACKVAPALAAGCTMVLKPSEVAPLDALIFAEVLHEAGVPAGVFNLINGDGPVAGAAMAAHPEVDMVSFTGSTRAGVDVAIKAAPTVKRVAQELGGKSANIILADADFDEVITRDMVGMCSNSGQSCNAPTRMLVPHARMEEAARIAAAAAESVRVGDPLAPDTDIGPVVSDVQWGRIQNLIEAGIAEGARLETGGPGRPAGLETGYYVRPTVFSHVSNQMRIAREEVFGPVLVLIGYEDDEEALAIANDTPYGLSGYISSSDPERALALAKRIRSGNVHINGASLGYDAPFGGYGQSGNGREAGLYGLEEFLETKAIVGA